MHPSHGQDAPTPIKTCTRALRDGAKHHQVDLSHASTGARVTNKQSNKCALLQTSVDRARARAPFLLVTRACFARAPFLLVTRAKGARSRSTAKAINLHPYQEPTSCLKKQKAECEFHTRQIQRRSIKSLFLKRQTSSLLLAVGEKGLLRDRDPCLRAKGYVHGHQ